MKCPHCNISLSPNTIKNISVDYCKKCHGVWFETGVFETCFKTAYPNKFDNLLASKEFIPEKFQFSDSSFCPKCKKEKLIEGNIGEMPMSKCEKCKGTFLTKEEISTIDHFATKTYADYAAETFFDGILGLLFGRLPDKL